MPPCIVALIEQSMYLDGEPNGSISTIDALLFFLECELRNLHVSSSEISKFFKLFIFDEFKAISSAFGFTSLIITFSTPSISFATLNPLAPNPDNPSKKIFGNSKSFQNAEYAIIDISLLNFALGLKNAGSFGGIFSVIEPFGTIIFVLPSTISTSSSFILVVYQSKSPIF